jgi:hypothetical protein
MTEIEDLEDIFINITDMGFELDAFIGQFSRIKVPFFKYSDIDIKDLYEGGSFKSLIVRLQDVGSFVDSELIKELHLVIERTEKIYNVKFKTLKISQSHWLSITEDNNLEGVLQMFKNLYISPYRKKPLNNNLDLIFEVL